MRFSYNWLKEFLPELTASPAEVAEKLTLHSFETVVAGQLAIDPHVTVARITKLQPHPNADRLRLATITTGEEELIVVCGAPNIFEGAVVPFSPPGTVLSDGEGGTFTLTTAKIRGLESPGMLNSARELGLSDWHGGIYLLPPDTPLGSRLADHLPADTLLEADITPNRAHDCLCHRGVARELAALFDLSLQESALPELVGTSETTWRVTIEDPNDTLRYLGAHLTNVTVGPSPLKLQARLWAMGARPINNVVDITNYVLYELGNPTHAFDAAKLPEQSINVQRAAPGQSLTTLDEVARPLNDELVITSGTETVAIAGIMGGAGTHVTEGTTEIFLEAASFRSFLIQQASANLQLRTESSARFSKGLTPALVAEAAARVVALLEEYAGATLVAVQDVYPRPSQPQSIFFRPAKVATVMGADVAPEEIEAMLARLRMDVSVQNDGWQVTPPLDRLDLVGEHDIVEEVARLHGLGAIPATTPTVPTAPASMPERAQWRELVRDYLFNQGFTETYNYSFADDEFAQWMTVNTDSNRLALRNPVAPTQRFLRSELLPELLQQVITNKAEFLRPMGAPERALYELGSVFAPGGDGAVPGVEEYEHVAGVLVGERGQAAEAHGIVDGIVQLFGVPTFTDNLGHVSALPATHKIVRKLGLPVAVFELNLDALRRASELTPTWQPQLTATDTVAAYVAPRAYPPIFRDLSILVEANTSVEEVQAVIERVGGELLVDVDLFDDYQPAGSQQRAVAFHLMYQSGERTLTNDEVAQRHNEIVATLQKEVGATAR